MKVGDRIFSKKVRPSDVAIIVKMDAVIKERSGKKEVRTTYVAKYDDGSEITFYGFNINKTIFKYEGPDGQLSLFDYICKE